MPRVYPPTIEVPTRLPAKPHRAAARLQEIHRTLDALRRNNSADLDPRRYIPETRVTQATVPRALRILNAVWTEAERRGWNVNVPGPSSAYRRPDESRTVIMVGEVSCAVRIVEEARMPKKKPRSEPYRWEPSQPLTATGMLRIELDEYWAPQKVWTDGPKMRVEDKLGALLETIEVGAARHAITLAERRQREKEYQAAATQRALEQDRTRRILDAAEKWSQASYLRTFIKVAREAGLPPEWIDLANRCADDIDPLVRLAQWERFG